MAKRSVVVEDDDAVVCPFCSAPAPGVYALPPRVSREHPYVRPACYFCYIRMAGIKPTRSRLVSVGHRSDGTDVG
jgi:hypothetical protein